MSGPRERPERSVERSTRLSKAKRRLAPKAQLALDDQVRGTHENFYRDLQNYLRDR